MAWTAEDYLERMVRTRKSHLKNIDVTGKMIVGIYQRAAKDLAEKAAAAKHGSLTERWALDYQRALVRRITQMRAELGTTIKSGMITSARLPGAAIEGWLDDALKMIGVDGTFTGTLSRAPDDALRALLDGRMYRDGKSLSRRIWSRTAQLQGNIEEIVAQGIAQHRSALELSRDLEDYVNPKAKVPVSWHKLYPDIPFDRQIDYNAQRLARTAINQSYWAAQIETAKANPFCRAIHWQLSPSHYERQVAKFGADVCDDYAAHNEGLGVGNWPIDKVPMPHAQCLCATWQVVPELDDVADRLGRWVDGGRDAELERAFGVWKLQNGISRNKFIEERNGIYLTGSDDHRPSEELLRRTVNTYNRIAKDFPALRKTLGVIGFGNSGSGVCGFAPNGSMFVSLDQTLYADPDKLQAFFKEVLDSGHTRNASDPMFIFAHELGHALTNTLAMQKCGLADALPYDRHRAFHDMREKVGKMAVQAAFEKAAMGSQEWSAIAAEMGERGTDDELEFIAQSVATWYYGDESHPIADAVVAMLKKEMK